MTYSNTPEEISSDMMGPLHNLLEIEIKRVGSQSLLAQLIGIPRSTLTGLINGRPPRLKTLAKIANYYDVTIPELFSMETAEEVATLHQRIFATIDELRRLLEAELRGRQ